PARRTGPQVLGRGPPYRRTGDPAVTIRLPGADGRLRVYEPRREPLAVSTGVPFPSRTVFPAAPVVAGPYADVSPASPAALDGDASPACRRHRWSPGLAVA